MYESVTGVSEFDDGDGHDKLLGVDPGNITRYEYRKIRPQCSDRAAKRWVTGVVLQHHSLHHCFSLITQLGNQSVVEHFSEFCIISELEAQSTKDYKGPQRLQMVL
ncbi:hypothetical protein E2C01_006076 [Portunus trituberculatus]|uniref:Uncharacterized protein n=1 Tax=Portunus trituberculatus TaxID=210409 RepID=A0A5B7CX68_PORTR|nr:hypothetical protein [Portunus trituberculatus]